MTDKTPKIEVTAPPNSFMFLNKDNKTVITIYGDGTIKFNKEDFPNLTADDFAKEFIEVIEKHVFRYSGDAKDDK